MGRLYSGVMPLPPDLEPAGAAALNACKIVDRLTDAADMGSMSASVIGFRQNVAQETLRLRYEQWNYQK